MHAAVDPSPGMVVRAEPAYVNLAEMRRYTSKVPEEDMRRFSMMQVDQQHRVSACASMQLLTYPCLFKMPAVHGFATAPKQDDDFECNRIEASENQLSSPDPSQVLQRPKQKPVGPRDMPAAWGRPRKSAKTSR